MGDKHSLISHIKKVHTGTLVPTYKCTYYDKRFFTPSKKEEHERVHTGEKTFCCWLCPDKFPRKNSLVSHLSHIHKLP